MPTLFKKTVDRRKTENSNMEEFCFCFVIWMNRIIITDNLSNFAAGPIDEFHLGGYKKISKELCVENKEEVSRLVLAPIGQSSVISNYFFIECMCRLDDWRLRWIQNSAAPRIFLGRVHTEFGAENGVISVLFPPTCCNSHKSLWTLHNHAAQICHFV